MYKVMIVDDELLILDGLKKLIDWEKLGLNIVNTAVNGEDAVEKFISNPVDIIITDINMPKMNGLKLIKNIKNINSKTKFIILSGYDEFEYAKEAIPLGIENYILKPINEEELESTLKNTIDKLDSNLELPILEEEKLRILKDNILYRWINGDISSYELKEREFILGISLDFSKYLVSILKLKEKQIKNRCEIYNLIEKEIKKIPNCVTFNDLENNIIFIYGSNECENMVQQMKQFFESLAEKIIQKFNTNYFITIGNTEKNFENVKSSYEKAKNMQDYIIILGQNKIITYEDFSVIDKGDDICNINIQEFNKILLSKNIQNIENYIDTIFDKIYKCQNIKPKNIQNIVVKIIFSINQLMNELKIDNENNHENVKDLLEKVFTINGLEELKQFILSKCIEFINKVEDNSDNISPIIKQVISYIDKNYYEELSLKTLGYKYNINPSYLGQVFHKEIKEPFSDYLTRIRNEKAKYLLLNTNLKVNEISKKVGYTDTSYFYRKFKEFYGISPNSMRALKNYKL